MEILGVRVDNLTVNEVLQKVENFLNDDKQHYIVTPNPEFLVEAQKDEEFRTILNQADLAIPDGIGLIFASRFLGQPIKERVTGTDLMEQICQRASQMKWPVFLLGGEEGVAEKAAENLRKKYRGLEAWQVSSGNAKSPQRGLFAQASARSPCSVAFGDLTRNHARSLQIFPEDTLPSLYSHRPAILFVALGAPKQEKWIAANLAKMPAVKLAIGVGGAFDFISGRVKRAPKSLRLLGLEWLWRLMFQPWRVRRISKAVIKFPYLIINSARTRK